MKKCIVLDLDNTLWGGIVGEDGMNGLALSLSALNDMPKNRSPIGKAAVIGIEALKPSSLGGR